MTISAQRVFTPVWVIVSQSIFTYYTLIRHSHPLSQLSQFRWLYFKSLPDGIYCERAKSLLLVTLNHARRKVKNLPVWSIVWAADESFPALRPVFLPGVPSPLRREEDWVHVPGLTFPNPAAFPMERLGRLLHRPDTGFGRENMTTLQCSLYAAARVVACPPVPV
jgi:hypothetical protein